jgi:hypothetical protein
VPEDVLSGPWVNFPSPDLTAALTRLHSYYFGKKKEIVDKIAENAAASKGDAFNIHKNGDDQDGGVIHAPFKTDPEKLSETFDGKPCNVTTGAFPFLDPIFQMIRKCLKENMDSYTTAMDEVLCDQKYNTIDERIDIGTLKADDGYSTTAVKSVVAYGGDVGMGSGGNIILTQLSEAYLGLETPSKTHDAKRHKKKFHVKKVRYDASTPSGAAMTMTSSENLGWLHSYLDGTTGVRKAAPACCTPRAALLCVRQGLFCIPLTHSIPQLSSCSALVLAPRRHALLTRIG